MDSTRSTSPEKSAWPGVSTRLIRYPFQSTVQCLDRIVIPRSRSRSYESITRCSTRAFSRNTCAAWKIESISVVLPWSIWAMIARFRMCAAESDMLTLGTFPSVAGGAGRDRGLYRVPLAPERRACGDHKTELSTGFCSFRLPQRRKIGESTVQHRAVAVQVLN